MGVIAELIAATLDRSDDIDGEQVRRTLEGAAPAGTALVAAGYTDTSDVTLVAAPLHLTIRTVTGLDAFKTEADENLNLVPGAATAQGWIVYLPRPAGLASLVEDVVATSEHLSAAPPPSADSAVAKSAGPTVVDLRRLDPSRRS